MTTTKQYDFLNRLAQISSAPGASSAVLFNYVYNAANSSGAHSYLWGLDLSGSEQGAGGVGGLLADFQITNCGFPAYDGNGNVTACVDSGTGTISARYEYGPFGELLRATGPMAKANAFRFSAVYRDDETDLLYYGYRYYNPIIGRWLSRDPAAEKTALADCCFVSNAPVTRFDVRGLCGLTEHRYITEQALRNAAPATTTKCKNRMLTILLRGNLGQDLPPPVGHMTDLPRHFNREIGEDAQKGIGDYNDYKDREGKTFSSALDSPSLQNCHRSLLALGRLMHSWQDFYAHAVLETNDTGGFTFRGSRMGSRLHISQMDIDIRRQFIHSEA